MPKIVDQAAQASADAFTLVDVKLPIQVMAASNASILADLDQRLMSTTHDFTPCRQTHADDATK